MTYGNIYERYEPGIKPPEEGDLASFWFAFNNGKLLVDISGNNIRIPLLKDLSEADAQPIKAMYLGLFDKQPCYCTETDCQTPNECFSFRELRSLFGILDDHAFLLAGRAIQLLNWDRTSRFCGRCGSPNGDKPDERAKICPTCGLVIYPRISPAVITVGNIRYFASQPWPYPDSLMIGFTAEYVSGEILVDGVEISDAGWYTKENLPELPMKLSIARKIIDWFIETDLKYGRNENYFERR